MGGVKSVGYASVVWLLLSGCGDDGASGVPGNLGRLAFSEKGSGKLVVLDVETGARTEITPELGAPGAIALEPDGDHVAFAVQPMDFERHVFVGDIATGEHHEVLPQTGNYGAGFTWGHGGWFTYMSWLRGPEELRLATTSSADTRVVSDETRSVLPSPTEAAYVVRRCTEPAPPGENCPSELVYENVAGDRRTVFATGLSFWSVALIDQGRSWVGYEGNPGELHLTVREIVEGGNVTDLGMFQGWLELSASRNGLSSISPGETEILTTTDGTQVLAVRLDGGGQRVVAEGHADRAGFTTMGDVLIESHVNLTPGSDTPEYQYTLALSRDGVVTPLLEDARGCSNDARVSASGRFAAWACDEGTIVFSLEDGSRVATHPGGEVLGFTPDDESILLLPYSLPDEYTVELRAHSGSARTLAHPAYQTTEHGNVEWPPAAYSPVAASR